jgi:flagellar hook-basal body complex protein FliE
MKDITLVSHLNRLADPPANPSQQVSSGFGDVLASTVKEVNSAQIEADRSIERLHTGEDVNLHEVMLSVEKADISMRLLVQMRNKVVEAYQEIMRMQV